MTKHMKALVLKQHKQSSYEDAPINQVIPLRDGDQWFQRLYDKESGLMKIILKP